MSRAEVERELRDLCRHAGLAEPEIRWTEALDQVHRRNARRYAQTIVYEDPPVFELAPQTVWLPEPQRHGLLAHEVGHVLDPDGDEDDADAAAASAFGVLIGYDRRWPGKGLQVRRNPDAGLRGLERRALAESSPESLARLAHYRRRRGEAVEPWEMHPISYVFLRAYALGPEGRVEAIRVNGKRERFYVGASQQSLSGPGVEHWLEQGYVRAPSQPFLFRVGGRRSDPTTLRGIVRRFNIGGGEGLEAFVDLNADVLPRGFVTRFNTAVTRGVYGFDALLAAGPGSWGPEVTGLTLKIPPRHPDSWLVATGPKGAGPHGGGGGFMLKPDAYVSARLMERRGERWRNNPDERLRELERRFQSTGGPEDAVRWLLERKRSGQPVTPKDLIRAGLATGYKKPEHDSQGNQVVRTGHRTFDRLTSVVSPGQVVGATQISNVVRPFSQTTLHGRPDEIVRPAGQLQDFDLGHFYWEDVPPPHTYRVQHYVRQYARDEPVILYQFRIPRGQGYGHRTLGFVLTDYDGQLIEVFSASHPKAEQVMREVWKYVSWVPTSPLVAEFFPLRRPLGRLGDPDLHYPRLGLNPDPSIRQLEREAAQGDPAARDALHYALLRAGRPPDYTAQGMRILDALGGRGTLPAHLAHYLAPLSAYDQSEWRAGGPYPPRHFGRFLILTTGVVHSAAELWPESVQDEARIPDVVEAQLFLDWGWDPGEGPLPWHTRAVVDLLFMQPYDYRVCVETRRTDGPGPRGCGDWRAPPLVLERNPRRSGEARFREAVRRKDWARAIAELKRAPHESGFETLYMALQREADAGIPPPHGTGGPKASWVWEDRAWARVRLMRDAAALVARASWNLGAPESGEGGYEDSLDAAADLVRIAQTSKNPPLDPLSPAEARALRSRLGRRVAETRGRLGLSQRALAKRMGRSPSWVREIEAGAQYAPHYLVLPMAEAAEVPLSYFYGAPPGQSFHLHGGTLGADAIRAQLNPPPARPNPPFKTPPPCDPSSRPLPKGTHGRVRVHVNLHNGCYVVSQKGKVVGYTRTLTLKNVLPKVSLAGWERCNREQVRNVHAYLEGDLVKHSAKVPVGKGWRKITYNCKVAAQPCFVDQKGRCVEGAQEARFVRTREGRPAVYVKGRAPAKKNPGCGCNYPGGVCACGVVDGWWREPAPGCA